MTSPACSVTECTEPAQRKGWCQKHYMQQYRRGTTALLGPKPKPCATCGQVFTPKTNRVAYCSDICRRGEASCVTCGKAFLVKKGATGKYCSRDCWYASAEDRRRLCPICEQLFQGVGKSCSPECGRELVRRNNPRRTATCARCGVPLVGKKPHVRYCSRSCSMYARTHARGGVTLPDGTRRPASTGYVQIKVDGRWVLEHRHVIEEQIGRSLEPHERVHHKNGRRYDNSPENLELWKVKGRKDPAGVRQSDYHCPGCRCEELGTWTPEVPDAEVPEMPVAGVDGAPVADLAKYAVELLRLYRPDLLAD